MFKKIAGMLMGIGNDQSKSGEFRRENSYPRTSQNLGQLVALAGSVAAGVGGLLLVIKTGTELFSNPLPKVHGRMEKKHNRDYHN